MCVVLSKTRGGCSLTPTHSWAAPSLLVGSLPGFREMTICLFPSDSLKCEFCLEQTLVWEAGWFFLSALSVLGRRKCIFWGMLLLEQDKSAPCCCGRGADKELAVFYIYIYFEQAKMLGKKAHVCGLQCLASMKWLRQNYFQSLTSCIPCLG